MYGTIRAVLKTLLSPLTEPVGVIVKVVLVSPLKLVPLAVRLPLTEIADVELVHGHLVTAGEGQRPPRRSASTPPGPARSHRPPSFRQRPL